MRMTSRVLCITVDDLQSGGSIASLHCVLNAHGKPLQLNVRSPFAEQEPVDLRGPLLGLEGASQASCNDPPDILPVKVPRVLAKDELEVSSTPSHHSVYLKVPVAFSHEPPIVMFMR